LGLVIALKRVYEPANADDGFRVLVDRLWPRGVSKDEAAINLWLKDAAPSTALRQWFQHKSEKWEPFKARYFAELDSNREALAPVLKALATQKVTLVFASRETRFTHAAALREYLLALAEHHRGHDED
jgi:uncharacterized protein YeaO (DUF488 family)